MANGDNGTSIDVKLLEDDPEVIRLAVRSLVDAGPPDPTIAGRTGSQLEVLLAEDNAGDVRLVMEAMRDSAAAINLNVVLDGEEAMGFLRREGEFSWAPRPHLILLDLNLPKKDGREVLAEIKADASLRRIPVIILTTSRALSDIGKAYDLNANCYITKPGGLEHFFQVMKSIWSFWSGVVELPRDQKEERE